MRKNKRSFCVAIVILAFIFLFSACSDKVVLAVPTKYEETETPGGQTEDIPQEVQNSEETSPLLWKVCGKESQGCLYLFGSMHVADKMMYPLPDTVMDAFYESDALAVEIDITEMTTDISAQIEMLRQLMLTDGTKVTDHMSQELYERLKSFLENSIGYYEAYDLYNLYYWNSLVEGVLMSKTDFVANLGIDSYFLTLAHENEKEILEIETMDFQIGLLGSIPDELQAFMLEYTLDNQEAYGDELTELYEAYRTGDEKLLTKLVKGDTDEEINYEEYPELSDAEIELLERQYEEYQDAILYDRNINMTEYAEEYIQSGKNVFYVVGVAHMLGDGGIVDQLRAGGYTVTQIEY